MGAVWDTPPAMTSSPPSSPAPPTPAPGLTSFWHDLPREGKLLLSVVVLEFLGTGLVLPFHVVYLHEVRGFALSDVGLLLGSAAAGRVPRGRPGRHRSSTGSAPARILVGTLGLLIARRHRAGLRLDPVAGRPRR